jgi:beta-glucosidase
MQGKKIATLITSLLTLGVMPICAQTLPYQDESLPIETRVKDALSRMTLKEKCRLSYAQSKFSSPGCPRLGIPELWMSDGPHGVRVEINWNDWGWANWTNDSVTAFPALTALAATWNPDLAAIYGKALGEEARYREKDVLLGPGVNIYRTPLNGRNFEYMGEDPCLSSQMVVPYVKALQKNGVSCCVKHFIFNDQEEFRGHVDVRVSDRAVHEIYLPPFKAAIQKGDAWSLMGSYNQYNDIHCCHNPYTINNLLKDELGFKGAVISDWGGAHDTREAALYGLDLEMGSYTNGLTTEAQGFTYDDYYLGNAYYNMAAKGEVPMEVVDDKAGRMLALNFKTAMNRNKPYGTMNSPEHITVARKIADEAVVLLKNDKGLLPLDIKKYKKILVVGENATRQLCPGGGSSELKAKDEVSPLRGLQERFGNEVEIVYKPGYMSGKCSYDGIDIIADNEQAALRAEALSATKDCDLIIYIGGLNKNHFEDCEGGDRRSYNMSWGQDELISSLAKTGKPMVTVIVSGNAYAMPWIKQVSTLVQSWYLGSEAGHALADILSGDVCPSGKTVFTYAKKLEDYPAHKFGKVGYPGVRPDELPTEQQYKGTNQPKSADLLKALMDKKTADALTLNTSTNGKDHDGNGDEVQIYGDDIMVGYRYFDTAGRDADVVFPFGFGLSYTTFQYSGATITGSSGNYTASVTVKNTGKVAGKETVQLYIGDDKASVMRPQKELKGFQKISLEPGEQKTVSFSIIEEDLRFYDENQHKWVAEPGTFKAYIGSSSRDIKAKLSFEL